MESSSRKTAKDSRNGMEKVCMTFDPWIHNSLETRYSRGSIVEADEDVKQARLTMTRVKTLDVPIF
jgi:hypothetical protein